MWEIWVGTVEKTEKKLANWKPQYLSVGGRVTSINSVLNSLPTYVMSLFLIPTEVSKKTCKLRRDFLWLGTRRAQVVQLDKNFGVLESRI